MLQHIGNNRPEQGADFLAKWLFLRHEDTMILVAKDCSLLVVKHMDTETTAAMWTQSKTSLYSQRIILKFLRKTFGRQIIIPEKKYKRWVLT